MKLKSIITVMAIVSQIAGPAVHGAFADSQMSGSEKVKLAVASAKEATIVLGLSNEQAYAQLRDNLASAHVNSTDVISYMAQYASSDEQAVFNEAFESKSADPSQMATILGQIADKASKRGAHFKLSCGAGLGIGIPLALAGIITGICYLSATVTDAKIQVNQTYADSRNNATSSYLGTKGKLNTTIAQANQVIAVDQANAVELQRKINSGFYGTDDVQKFYAQIATINADIVAQQNIAGGINAQLVSLQEQYNAQMQALSDRESIDLVDAEQKNRLAKNSKDTLAYVAVPLTVIGITFIASTDFSDCN